MNLARSNGQNNNKYGNRNALELLQKHKESAMLIESEFRELERINLRLVSAFNALPIGITHNDNNDIIPTDEIRSVIHHDHPLHIPYSGEAVSSRQTSVGPQDYGQEEQFYTGSEDLKSSASPRRTINDNQQKKFLGKIDNTLNSSFDDLSNDSRLLANETNDFGNSTSPLGSKNANNDADDNNNNNNIAKTEKNHQHFLNSGRPHPQVRKLESNSDYDDDDQDQGFNSHEFSSLTEDDFSSAQVPSDASNQSVPGNQRELDEDLITAAAALNLNNDQILERNPKLKTLKEESFLESSSPNQEIMCLRNNSKISVLKEPITLEEQAEELPKTLSSSSGKPQETELSLEKINYESLENNKNMNTQTADALKQLLVNSSNFIDGKLEINKNLNEKQINDYENNQELSDKLYQYNEDINHKGNKLIHDLNGIIQSFN